MNNKCPTCGSPYNINASHVGRSFSCQKCQSQLVVQPDGLQVAGVQQPQAPVVPPQTSGMPQGGAGAYDEYGGQGAVSAGSVQKGGPSWIMDFLLFRRMIAPLIIMISFWLSMIACVLLGLISIVMGMVQAGSAGVGSVFLGFLTGIAFFTIIPLWVRVLHEFFMVTFRINETLTDILNELKRG